MNIEKINVPITLAASSFAVILSFAAFVDVRYALADDMQGFQINEAIKSDKLWLELLEIKLDQAKTETERERILRQIEITTQSLYSSMEKR